jgi:molybdate transport system substrate-binding protein
MDGAPAIKYLTGLVLEYVTMPRPWFFAPLLLAAAGCGTSKEQVAPAVVALKVAAASDLQTALPLLAERIRQAHGMEIVPVFGSSGQLAQQIEQGAPYDVFLSANKAFVEKLSAKGDVKADSVTPYAQGLLVLVVNRRSGVAVSGLLDLTKPEVKHVAIANPDLAPYGLAAKQALERSGLAAVTPKLVQAESIRQALRFVQTGNAEVGLVAHSVADVPEVRLIDLDRTLYDPVVQYLGIVSRTENSSAAKKFADFLLSDEGQKLFVSFGFVPPARTRAIRGEDR